LHEGIEISTKAHRNAMGFRCELFISEKTTTQRVPSVTNPEFPFAREIDEVDFVA
jgi:hypothetical protein